MLQRARPLIAVLVGGLCLAAPEAWAAKKSIARVHKAQPDPFSVPEVTLSKIEVSGNRRIESDAILEKMTLKAGKQLSPEGVRADIQAIFAMGYFEDIRFELDGTVLAVKLRERPVINKIRYSGNDEFETKDMEE